MRYGNHVLASAALDLRLSVRKGRQDGRRCWAVVQEHDGREDGPEIHAVRPNVAAAIGALGFVAMVLRVHAQEVESIKPKLMLVKEAS